jgi:serine/threonine-protein kinase
VASGVGPRILGRYQIEDEIGRGMMGIVYRAYDPALGRTVALKTVSLTLAVPEAEREAFEQRFLNEARVAAALSHPGIVVVHDVGRDTESSTLFIALEYIEGRTLADVVKEDGLPPWPDACRLVARLAEALHHAHARQVVHRDVKPANIMVLPSGEPKLMDFGIAKVPAAELTGAGQFFGTPSYMSPEQALGAALDHRSDVFSLGAVLYFALTGQRAFDGTSVPTILARITHAHPPGPSSVRPGVPREVDEVVARCLCKRPEDRYPSARHLSEDIEDILAGRAPRHRGEWTPPLAAESTLNSNPLVALLPAAPPAEAALTLDRPDPPTGPVPEAAQGVAPVSETSLVLRVADRVGRAGWLVLAVALGIGLLLPLFHSAPSPVSALAPAPAAAPLLPILAEPAHLEITLDHPLRTGMLRVWVDDELVLEEDIAGRVRKKILTFRLHKGSEKEVLDVAPGEHQIRVEVESGSYRERIRTKAEFRSGQTRRLAATVDGLLKKELSLAWVE